jgi:hypothetical protein
MREPCGMPKRASQPAICSRPASRTRRRKRDVDGERRDEHRGETP